MRIIAYIHQLPTVFQIVRTITRGSSGDISLAGLCVAALCSISWLGYGIKLRDKPLILTNILGSILVAANLFVTTLYR